MKNWPDIKFSSTSRSRLVTADCRKAGRQWENLKKWFLKTRKFWGCWVMEPSLEVLMFWCMVTTYNKLLAVLCHDNWHTVTLSQHHHSHTHLHHLHHLHHQHHKLYIETLQLLGDLHHNICRLYSIHVACRPWSSMIRVILSTGWYDETIDETWDLGQALAVYYCQFSIVLTNWGNTLICEDCFLITFTFSSIINTIFCRPTTRGQPLYPIQVTVQSIAVQWSRRGEKISNSTVEISDKWPSQHHLVGPARLVKTLN